MEKDLKIMLKKLMMYFLYSNSASVIFLKGQALRAIDRDTFDECTRQAQELDFQRTVRR